MTLELWTVSGAAGIFPEINYDSMSVHVHACVCVRTCMCVCACVCVCVCVFKVVGTE